MSALIPSGFVALIFLCFAPRYATLTDTGGGLPTGVNGGVACLACTAVVALTEQLSVIHNETFVEVYERVVCNHLPSPYKQACFALGAYFIPQIIKLITAKESADVICHAINLCYQEKDQPYCHAFPARKHFQERVSEAREEVEAKLFYESATADRLKGPKLNPCTLGGVKEVCELFTKAFNNDLPLIDLDNDTYSASVEAWRGTSWRGRDCNDLNHQIHPGAKPRNGDVIFDTNCNGIFGLDPINGKPFEELFCQG